MTDQNKPKIHNLSKREEPLTEFFHLEGQMAMAHDLAIWKDGKIYVGVLQIEYKQFIAPLVKRQLELLGRIESE